MALDFTVLEDAKGVVLERFPGVDEEELEALLIASACTTPAVSPAVGEPFYQPYLIAGHLIRSRWQQYKRLKSAAGSEVEYSDADAAFVALLQLQIGLSSGMTCPSSWNGLGATFEAVL